MNEPYEPQRGWFRKFADAIRGVRVGARAQSSFAVHVIATIAVIAAGVFFGVSLVEWCLLTLCIAVVIAAELFNSSLETLAKSINQHFDPSVRDALDIASGAVLIASIGAAAVGLIVFVPRIVAMISSIQPA